MTERDSEHPVSRALEELGTVDPPAGLVENVMMRISSSASNRFAGRIVPFDRGGITMIKKAMWGLAAAAAVLLAVFTVIGFPSANRGTEATIGAAQKYQAPQLAAGDVKVGDASVQEFLQSESFDRLLKDPQARSILSDGRIREQLINRSFVNSLEDMQKRRQLSSDILHRFYSDTAAVASLNRYLASGLAVDAALARLADDAALAAATRDVLAQMRQDAGLLRMLDDNAIRVALSNDLFRQFARDAAAMAALTSNVFVSAIRQQGFVDAYQSGAIAQAVAQALAR
jgi:hypothetical protein